MIKRICASLPCLVVFTFCVIALVLSSSFTDWHLVYAIDDSYIHLALARNLAETGVWGIRPDEYAFASSSPLWTCILAATFRLFGYHEIFAALYAVFFCVASTFVVERIFAFGIESSLLRRILTVGTMLALPVTTAAILGMEHAMHVFSAVLLVYLYFRRAGPGAMFLAAFFAVGTRYESLFVVVPLLVIELFQRRWRESLALLTGALLVPLCYGAFSMAHDGCFLPNSLMIKSALSIRCTFFDRLLRAAICGDAAANSVVQFTWVVLFTCALAPGLTLRARLLLLALAISVFGHLVFAKTGWTYNINRYEMYLFAISIPVVVMASWHMKFVQPDRSLQRVLRLMGAVMGGIYMMVVLAYGLCSGTMALLVPRETYETPMIAADVLAAIPKERQGAVFVNDLGLIAERTAVPIIDVCGLGEQDTFELRRAGIRDTKNMAEVLKKRHARYAAVFPPPMWASTVLGAEFGLQPVAMLTRIHQDAWATGPLLLYAFDPDDEKFLANHLRNLQFEFPEGVSFVLREDLKKESE